MKSDRLYGKEFGDLMQESQMSSFRNGIWVLILNGLKDADFEWDFLDDWVRATGRPMEMSGDLEEESVLHSQDTPCKIKMEHTNHPFRKENDLPNPYEYVPC